MTTYSTTHDGLERVLEGADVLRHSVGPVKGMRIAPTIVLTGMVTAVVAQTAIATYTASVAGLPAAEAQQSIAAFRDILTAVGTPSFDQVAAAVTATDVRPYLDAYAAGVRAAFGLGGIAAVVGGAIAWVALGRRDPLVTVWEHRDEREVVAG